MSKLELGKSAPSQEVFLRLADAFGFDADTVASQLDDAALAALSDVTAVRSALAGHKARTQRASRAWLTAGLVGLVLGGACAGLLLLADDTRYTEYVYQSPGVIAPGEDSSVYRVLSHSFRPNPDTDNDEQAALRARHAEMLTRADLDIRRLRDRIPHGFVETVDGGRRHYELEGGELVVERSPLRWFKVPALMFFMGAFGCFFISFRWR